jgi:dTDP-4-dehydrorhamnose 3,5-epimerase
MPFQFQRLDIPEVLLIEPRTFKDHRGFFMETYKRSDFVANGIAEEFVQSNYSHSTRGTLRGLHFQKHPQAQGKLLMAIRGEIFDVAVDIRKGSPTYGRWVSATLSDTNHRMLYVPVGFAHGFCVLSEEAGLVYHITAEYAQELEVGVLWNDPAIGIEWPISDPLLSQRDTQLPLLQEADVDFTYEG